MMTITQLSVEPEHLPRLTMRYLLNFYLQKMSLSSTKIIRVELKIYPLLQIINSLEPFGLAHIVSMAFNIGFKINLTGILSPYW